MKRYLTVIIMVIPFLFSCQDKTREAVREIPLEDFFRTSDKSAFAISPSGKYISFMAPYETHRNIFVQEVGSDSAVRITEETERGIYFHFWANDETIVFAKDVGGDENNQLFGVNVDGSNVRAYTNLPDVNSYVIDPLTRVEGEENFMIIATNERNPQIFDPYRLNLTTGERTLLAENPGNIQGWSTDNNGKLRVAYAIVDGVNTQLLYREREEDEFTPVLTTSFKESVSYLRFTPDNKSVYGASNLDRDKLALVIMEPKTAKEEKVLYINDKYDVSGIGYSIKNENLESVSYIGAKETVRHFFDKDAEARFQKLQKHFVGDEISVSAQDREENMQIVYVRNSQTPGTYYLYNVEKDEVTKLADVAPWINPEEMAEMLPIKYTSRDGLNIEGYLTLPVGETLSTAKDLPVVVNPHGGPWARDYWRYNPEIQFLANRGYAVFQMNFRGSTGFGRKFTEISYKQWGQTMQDDITDGVKWLIHNGVADPERIAIYGGSYGGYATLQGVVKTPDLYAAAIDYVGVSNLFTFIETIPPYWKPLLEMLYEQVGHPEKDSVMLAENSPALNADKITTPLFVVQGANDPRVNKNESDQMVEALRERGVEVEYMVKYDEGHGFMNQANKFDFYREMERFLALYLKGESIADGVDDEAAEVEE